MLTCENITKRYSMCTAVNHVNLQLMPGRVYALLGPNGSGKTTFMKMVAGLIRPDMGTITLDNEIIGTGTKGSITYMPTENYFYSYMKIDDIAKYYDDFFPDFNKTLFYSILEQIDLKFFDKVKYMSTGMLAKLKVAVAIARDSSVTMLDEPLNGIDIIARDVVAKAIRTIATPGRTIIVSSHLVEELEPLCTHAIFMKNGEVIINGPIDKIRYDNGRNLTELYRQIYGFGGNFYV